MLYIKSQGSKFAGKITFFIISMTKLLDADWLREYNFSFIIHCTVFRDAGTGGQEGQPPPLPFTRIGKGGQRFPFNLKDCLGEIANFQKLSVQLPNCSELSVQFFYEFALENAKNAVIELQE